MKLNNKFTLISVALMTGAACLTACSSDEVAENPNLSADGESVKTEFAINIPRAKSARMTAGNTQNGENPTFLGLNDIRLIPFDVEKSSLTAETAIKSIIGLGSIAQNTGLTDGVKKYSDVNIPIGTKSFYFYGHAPQGSADGEATQRFSLGILTENVTAVNALKGIQFGMVTTVADDANIANDQEAIDLLKQLNAVATVEGWANATADSPAKKLYDNFIKLKAGSANSIKLVMEDLYNAVEKFNTGETATLAQAIKDAITTGDAALFNAGEANAVTGNVTLSWKAEKTFPKNVNLPEGVAQVTFESNAFKYVTATNIGAWGGNSGMAINEKKITYPASLYYTSESAVAASQTADIPSNITAWSFDDWDKVVKTSSKSVALADKVNYGVANFAVSVKCDGVQLPTNGTQDKEQTAAEVNMNGNDFVAVPTNGFTLTGVLVGGQYQKVDYKFNPITEGSQNGGTYTIYDRDVQGVKAVANSAQGTNYTLVLPTQEADDNIHFALEFQNDAEGFYGKDGFIPHGATFYVVGKLVKQNANTQGNQDNATRIFQQDYKTTANVTLKTLKNAYYTLPDLRATNLSFGLAVDLTWQKGYVFDVTIE